MKKHGCPSPGAFLTALSRFEQAAVVFARAAEKQAGSEAEKKAARIYDARKSILLSMIGIQS